MATTIPVATTIAVAITIAVAARMPAAPAVWKMRDAVETETADR